MPWHLPADLQHFKAVTMGKPIIMGRKTFESIGRPLPGRQNIVISRNPDYRLEGCDTCTSFDAALALAGDIDEVVVVGGGFLYREVLPRANKLYLTFIELEVDGDTHFPEFEHLNLTETQRTAHQPDEKNPYPYTFVDFQID